jgi:hypothetical protein
MTKVTLKWVLWKAVFKKINIIWKMPKQQHLSKDECDFFYCCMCINTRELKIHSIDSHVHVPFKN